ncbi:MAG: coproporphyrinogen III oxidase, partial [Mangrovicoccus sp.]|nr:coproporphyrinogen III oxidase [Mangrovicoccus sp.]
RIIEALMCDFRVERAPLLEEFNVTPVHLEAMFAGAAARFPGFVELTAAGFAIKEAGRPLTRIIARAFDGFEMAASGHSSAV